ncbi:MAG: alpha/beta hydrolase [Myxococcales bacterium]|nr:alpha/beta hydrolase [Myxococcales bacterium]
MAEVTAGDGVKLYAEVHEPPRAPAEPLSIVLSCALCTTHENWRPQVEPLRGAGLRVVLWDYRGHGRSESPEDPEAYSMARVVDDLGRVLDWAAPGQLAVLGGLSFGGLASLHFALVHPARVRALVLVDSGPGFKNPEAQARWEAGVERTAGFLEARGMGAFVASRAADTAVGLRPELPAARAAADAIAAQDPHGLARFARLVAAPAAPVIDELASIRHPSLVIVGEKDDAYLRAAEVLAARLPEAEHVTIPRAGHMVNIEEAEAFNSVLIRFLRKLAASSSD